MELSEADFEGNIKWLAYMRSMERSMQCYNAKEVMNLILSSERAKNDLKYALEYENMTEEDLRICGLEPEKKLKWDVKLVFRKWVEGVNGMKEFRCFVKDNTMTAITQYNHPLLIEELQFDKNCEKIKLQIFSFWKEKIQPLFGCLKDYVIDFAILDNGSIFLIELNPFKDYCGSGMFKWNVDRDLLCGLKRDQSKSDLDNVVFRVRKNDEVSYDSEWSGNIQYIMEAMCEGMPYEPLLKEIENQNN